MEKLVALTSCYGRIVAAEIASNGWVLRASRSRIFGWETLTLVAVGSGQVALRTCHGFYVAALPAEQDWLLCGNRLRVQEWERFTPIEVGRYVALRTAHGRFVAAEPDEEGGVLRAASATVGGPERFGGGEVESAPPEGALADAFAPFEEGAFVWRGSLPAAVRELIGLADGSAIGAEDTPTNSDRPTSKPERAYATPIRAACGVLWL